MYMHSRERKKHQKKFLARIAKKPDVLLEQLRHEWDTMQKSARKEAIVRAVKEGGMAVMRPLLTLLAIGGVVTIAAIAPNVFAAVGRIGRRRLFVHEDDFRRCKYYFTRHKLARFIDDGEGLRMGITEKGRRQILRSSLDRLAPQQEERWDGIWRIVIFDIPDKHKAEREGFRDRLCQLRMYCMQESVFVTPYPCEREVEFLIYAFSIASYVRIIRTRELFDDDDLKERFHVTQR